MYVYMYVCKKEHHKGPTDNGDGNENGKKELGLDWQNNNFACV